MNGDPEITRYAVKVISKAVASWSGRELTREGEEFWICNDEWGPTGRRSNGLAADLLTFETRDEARQFASEWTGHPWYVQPKDWRVVEVKPKYHTCQSGWEMK